MKKIHREIIIAMCEYNMNVTNVAKKLFWCRNNVLYHISKIEELYGLDARKFYDLVKLEQMAKEPEKEVQIPEKIPYCRACGNRLYGRRRKYCSKQCMERYYKEHGFWKKITI